jgi:hypothetical protein
LTIVSPVKHYDNVHLTTSASPSISNLPNTAEGSSYEAATSSSLTTFNWPLGTTAANAQYKFGSSGTVIQFNPQGEAQIVTSPNTDSILQWIEIDLVPTHGTSTSGNSAKNPATILIDGASGSVGVYRA